MSEISCFDTKQIKSQFITSLKNNKLCHGWLVYGPKGAGKTSLVNWLVKFLLQNKIEAIEIDHQLPDIKQFENSYHPDVMTINSKHTIELEKKTHKVITIDEIRNLTSFLRLTPAQGKYRIAVIDDAEYMNYNASNALLKILEEPSDNAIIFLICNSIGKLPATVRSRCRILKCPPLSYESFKSIIDNHSSNLEELKKMYEITNGDISLALFLIKEKELDIISSINLCLEKKDPEKIEKIIEFAIKNQQNWEAITTILLNTLNKRIVSSACNGYYNTSHKLQIMDNIKNMIKKCELYHLDKSHTLLSAIHGVPSDY